MEWLKFAHILFIIYALALTEGPNLFILWALRDRDVAGLRRYARWSQRSEAWGTVAFVIALGFGFGAALSGTIDLLASWLVASYLLVAVTLIVVFVLGGRQTRLIEAALERSPDDEPSDELRAILRAPATGILLYGIPLLNAVVIGLMVTKPTLWGG